jgi:hypothetical protein
MKQMIIQSLLLFSLIITVSEIKAQPAEAPFHRETMNVDFGIHNGMSIDELDASGAMMPLVQPSLARTIAFPPNSYIMVEEHLATLDHAPWMQLVFGNVNLGENSYIIITSDFDQDQQFFNNQSIQEWMYNSAMFKGESVTVQLFVAPGDQNITLKVAELIAGEFLGGITIPLSLCGADNRLTSTFPHVDGRLMPLGCTGWNSAAGYYLTAGHCLDVGSSSLQIMEFNVPSSLPDGTTQPAAVNDQYPVIYSSRVFQNVQIGDDWGLYNCGANSNTGLTPLEGRRTFYHLTKDLTPANIFIRGFGTDETPPGSTGWRNAQSQTLQYSTGPSLGEAILSSTRVYWEYQVDTEGGNSGSAILVSGTPDFTSLGIHTNGGCSATDGNTGTGFEADDTEAAMNVFWQTETEFCDVDHHLSSTTGSSVYPHYSVQGAVNQANAGHGPAISALELIMVAGSNYNGTYGAGVYAHTLSYSGATNGVLIRRTAGAVKIGPNATAASANGLQLNSENGEK